MGKFIKPENGYSKLSAAERLALRGAALEDFAGLSAIADEEITDEQLDELEAIQTEIDAIDTADAEAEARADRLAKAKKAPAEKVVKDEDGDDDEDADADADADKDGESDDEDDDADDDADAKDRKSVVASAKGKGRKPVVEELEDEIVKPKVTITIAPDVRGYSAGQEVVGMKDLTAAFSARVASFGKGQTGRRGVSGATSGAAFAVAQIARPVSDKVTRIGESDNESVTMAKIMGLAKELRQTRGEAGVDVITAAAYNGWVTPSENFYDLCQWATFSGALVLPKVQVSRGGMNFTKGIDFSAIFSDTDGHFVYTESQMEGAPTKPFREIQVPSWTDLRLDAVGYGIKAPIPLRTTFPELLENYMEQSLIAYQKFLNGNIIGRVLTYLGGAVNAPEYGSGLSDVLQSLEFAKLQLIKKYALSDNQTVEVMLPTWIKAYFRAELSRRAGYSDNPFAVTDAQIETWFRARGIATQYVRDWQELDGTTSLTLPTTLQFGMWVPGTFVQGGDEIISLDAIYDQQNLEVNEYIAAFFEESLLVANTCGNGNLYTIGLNPYGMQGALELGQKTS